MAKKSISEIVKEIALPIVLEAGCELVDVEFVKEGSNWFLRVYIDKPEGISLDDCENVSRPLNKKIDEMDPISHEFFLEVSSPGLERTLKKPEDFVKAIGSTVEIRLFKAVDNTKQFEGELVSYEGEMLTIKTEDGKSLQFKSEQIAKVKTVFKF
ncbi:MAG: ribosome maturation factor RimP [Acetivibrionales bacterium]|jgi:ribosome maturation factor RimP|nr:ribosome maturation factor RimP [Clostridiaceae bacterium]